MGINEKLCEFDKYRIICYNKKHNLRVYLGLQYPSDKGQLKQSNCLHEVRYKVLQGSLKKDSFVRLIFYRRCDSYEN